MDLRKLHYFAGVVDAGSISKAADSLRVAQPALSKSLRSLERDLGVALLRRSPQGVVATDAARGSMITARSCSSRSTGRVSTCSARPNGRPGWWPSACRTA